MELKRIKQEINRLETYKIDGSVTDSGLELLAELKRTTELVKNINYDAVLVAGDAYDIGEFKITLCENTGELKVLVCKNKTKLTIKPNTANCCNIVACH